MKNTILKAFFLLTFLFLDFVAFAQSPGSDTGEGDLEGNDDPAPASINGKLVWLAILGVAFAYYTYKKTRTVEVSN